MCTTSQEKIKRVLTERLKLHKVEFHLEELSGGKISGNVISDTFDGMDDAERQRVIWDALDAEFGIQSTQAVGTLLAYTSAEWYVTLQD